jgi:hypothetical protein
MVGRPDMRAADKRNGLLGVIAKPQTYRNILYLLLGLPLGTLYFTVLVTGWSVGLSMLIVALSGIPILIGLWYLTRGFMSLERGLAVALLEVDVAPLSPVPTWTGGLWQQFKVLMRDRPTWRGVSYLLLRFPAGIATFTVAVTLVATSLGLAFAPTYMWTSDNLTWAGTTFDSFAWSFALVPVGIVLAFVSLHLMNALALACGRWAKASLGSTPAPEASRKRTEIDLTKSAQPARPRAEPDTDEPEPIEVEA